MRLLFLHVYLDFASGPFYGFNRPGANASQAVIQNWWRQGLAANREALVATHLPFPSVCHVAVAGDAFRCVPATWEF